MQEESTFTSDELDVNNKKKSKLIKFIKSGDAILMAGAGCSGSLFPLWMQLINELEIEAKSHDPSFNEDKNDLLLFADRVKECLGKAKYHAFIYKTFKPGVPTHLQYHEILCRLPFKAITTTNYDKVLECALNIVIPNPDNSLHFEGSNKVRIHEFLLSLNFNENLQKRIVHLHGVYDEDESIVLGGKEYSAKYGFALAHNEDTFFDQIQKNNFSQQDFQDLLIKYGYEWPLRRKLLWSLLATRRIFFIGFSLTDPYFRKMLEFVKDDLSTYNAESHFSLLRVTLKTYKREKEEADKLKKEFGIETVFFFDEEQQYTGLADFISELDQAINIPEGKISRVFESINTIKPASGNSALTDELFELSKQQDGN